FPAYLRHFEARWRASLRRKRELYPELYDFGDDVLALRMRPLTQWMVERNTDFGTLERYFDGYSVAGDRLAALQVPASILTAADDPVIPVEDFLQARLPASACLEISRWGGHCGFVEDAALNGFGERWLAERLSRPAPHRGCRLQSPASRDPGEPMYDNITDALRRGAAEEALALAREAVAQQPEDAQAYRMLAAAQRLAGEVDASLETIDRAIEL